MTMTVTTMMATPTTLAMITLVMIIAHIVIMTTTMDHMLTTMVVKTTTMQMRRNNILESTKPADRLVLWESTLPGIKLTHGAWTGATTLALSTLIAMVDQLNAVSLFL